MSQIKQKWNLKEIKSFPHGLEGPRHYFERSERKITEWGIKSRAFWLQDSVLTSQDNNKVPRTE